MKNAMKKLMSLVLVAMILVSALPFAASAESADAVTVVIVENATDKDVARFDKVPSRNGKSAVGDLLNYWANNNADVESATFLNAYAYYADDSRADVVEADTLSGGDKVRIRAEIVWKQPEETTAPSQPEETTQPAAPVVEPIKIVVKVGSSGNVVWTGEKVPANGEYALVENLLSYCWNKDWDEAYEYDYAWSSAQQAKVSESTYIYAGDTLSVMLTKKGTTGSNGGSNDNTTTGAQKYGFNSGKVTLRVYLGETIHKDYDIKGGIAGDGKVEMKEVWEFVKARYNAIDTDTGIKAYGIYVTAGQEFMSDYLYGEEYDIVTGLYDATQKGDIALKVVLLNAKAATSSSNADPTNPKTGDSIMLPVAVMTVSASILAVAFYLNKKRAF